MRGVRFIVLGGLLGMGLLGLSTARAATRLVSVKGHKVQVKIVGKGRGDPILLLQGGPNAPMADVWFKSSLQKLARSHEVVLVNPLGTGGSDPAIPGDYHLARQVDLLEGLRAELGHDQWTVIGHSAGGWLAGLYATLHPDSLKDVVLISSMGSGEQWQRSNVLEWRIMRKRLPKVWQQIEKLHKKGVISSDPRINDLFNKLYTPGFMWDDPENAKKTPKGPSTNPAADKVILGDDAYFEAGGDMAHFDVRRGLRKFVKKGKRILVLYGAKDHLIPDKEKFAQDIDATDFVVLPHAGHYVFRDTDEEKAFQVISDFLGKTGP